MKKRTKRIILFIIIALCFICVIYKMLHPVGNLSDTATIEVEYHGNYFGVQEETDFIKFSLTDHEKIKYICKNIKSLAWEKIFFANKPSSTIFLLRFFDEKGKEIEYLEILNNNQQINFPNRNTKPYSTIKGEIDLQYLYDLVEEYWNENIKKEK
ncbi:MAG: hypothetical protein J6K16_04105 [Alphaproteobacteria bacterium]|nr:hypothetical protein [Alphaproteobacteria bacterium]